MSSTIDYRIPKKDAAYLRRVCNKKDSEELPKAIVDIYTAIARISNRLEVDMTLTDIKLVCYIAGVGMEPPPPKTMEQLWNSGELKRGQRVEIMVERKASLDDEKMKSEPFMWVAARVTMFTPSRKTFVCHTEVGNTRYEVPQDGIRIPKEE